MQEFPSEKNLNANISNDTWTIYTLCNMCDYVFQII